MAKDHNQLQLPRFLAYVGGIVVLAGFGLWFVYVRAVPHAPNLGNAMYPDLTAWVACRDAGAAPTDGVWEKGLSNLRFETVNRPELARLVGGGPLPNPQSLEAIDPLGRIVQISSTAIESGKRYGVNIALYSPPPTHHDTALETGIETLLTSSGCTVTQVQRNDNPVQAVTTYNNLLHSMKDELAYAYSIKEKGVAALNSGDRVQVSNYQANLRSFKGDSVSP